MRINPEDVRQHYRSVPDEELLALDREELTETARSIYDEELARRGLTQEQEPGSPAFEDEEFAAPDEAGDDAAGLELETGPPPDWLGDAACAYSFTLSGKTSYASAVAQLRAVLGKAGIPCYITMNQWEAAGPGDAPQAECCAMVPSALSLHATSVLDRDILNARREEEWRTHLEALSDEDLLALKPEVFCAGLLDQAARLKRAYQDEMARRDL